MVVNNFCGNNDNAIKPLVFGMKLSYINVIPISNIDLHLDLEGVEV